jgi:hypothetical protein
MLSGSSALLTIGLGFERRHLSTWPRRPGRPRRLVVFANEMPMPSSSFNLSNPSLPDRALAERRIAVQVVGVEDRAHVAQASARDGTQLIQT